MDRPFREAYGPGKEMSAAARETHFGATQQVVSVTTSRWPNYHDYSTHRSMDARSEPHDAKPLTHRQTRLIVFGVLLPLFMGSLDSTILASALPTIGPDFDDVHSLPWLITAYLLAATAGMPLYGKIADIHGRRFTLRIAIGIHMAASPICALAPS